MTQNKVNDWVGQTVLVKRCLVDKPQHSGTPYGWIIKDAVVDASKREPCGAVGKVGLSSREDGVVPVFFLNQWPQLDHQKSLLETTLFAVPEDLEATDQPYTWPDVPGMVVWDKDEGTRIEFQDETPKPKSDPLTRIAEALERIALALESRSISSDIGVHGDLGALLKYWRNPPSPVLAVSQDPDTSMDSSQSDEESHTLRLVTHDEEGRFIAPTLVLDREDLTWDRASGIPDPAISKAAVEQVLMEGQADEIEGWHDEESEKAQVSDKAKAAQWARELLKSEFVIFDTETTGFEADDEIIQIGIIDQAGATVLERLIKPTKPVLNSMYHGITDDMLKDAPGFPVIYEEIKRALGGKTVVAYNLDYDRRMLFQDCHRHSLDPLAFTGRCAMEQYAVFNGEWNDYHGNYRWQKLREALAAFGLKHEDFGTAHAMGQEHDACTDARATLAVIKKMAEFEADKAVAAT